MIGDGYANTPLEQSSQITRKRQLPDESDDSFDAPIEFVSVEPKRIRCDEVRKTPLKQSSVVNSPQKKRSPKIHVSSYENAPPVNYVSDWSDSSNDSYSLLPKIPGKQISCIDSSELVHSFNTKKYYVDTLLQQKSRPPKTIVNCDKSLPSFSNEQVVLKVVELSQSDHETHHIVCTNTNNETVFVYLQDHWETILVEVGMEIRLIDAEPWGHKDYIVSSDAGIIIVEPDVLLTSTAISGAIWCSRKVVLNHRFKGKETANKAMLIGCIMHELFQIAVQYPNPTKITREWLFQQWREKISSQVLEAFVALNFSPKAFETELVPYADIIVKWVKKYMPCTSFSQSVIPTGSYVTNIHDIEENIWDPILGLKGKIDATVKSRDSSCRSRLEPLELKTGKSFVSSEHSCQVLLYSMMLSLRYDQPIYPGTLLYLKDGTTRAVEPKRQELIGIIQQRNNLAYYISQKDHRRLPEPRTNPQYCDKCDQKLACTLYVKQNEEPASLKFSEFVNMSLAHLDNIECEYFKRWSDSLFLENMAEIRSTSQKLSDLWKVEPEERELRGHAVASITLVAMESLENSNVKLVFERSNPFQEHILQPGSLCTVSYKDKFGIGICSVIENTDTRLSLNCERRYYFLKIGNVYDVDVYSSFSTFATTMGNLLQLINDSKTPNHLRSLIVKMNPPKFLSVEEYELPPTVQRMIEKCNLTYGQRRAVEQSLRAQDYSLVEGLPGSGKTTTIVVLIRCLLLLGKSVLLTSYTNSAVDTVLSKLQQNISDNQILRLGRVSCDSNIARLSLEKRKANFSEEGLTTESYHIIKKILKETPIVACTCYHASKELLLSWRTFDVCIVDEASMVLEPIVLPAILAVNKFILVGDAKQLAPLVLHKESKVNGTNISLFERLQTHKHAVSSLTEQFRMNSKIASISSQLFYDNRLICANKDVSNATIITGSTKDLIKSSELENSCIWVDVEADDINTKNKKHTTNEKEAAEIKNIISAFKEMGVNMNEIGVMCTYNDQAELLRNVVDVEVNTVDRYQGREKNIIIWSLVWTRNSEKKCELLYDERRVNVAVTRAKYKLIIVGCVNSMKEISIMTQVLRFMKRVST